MVSVVSCGVPQTGPPVLPSAFAGLLVSVKAETTQSEVSSHAPAHMVALPSVTIQVTSPTCAHVFQEANPSDISPWAVLVYFP